MQEAKRPFLVHIFHICSLCELLFLTSNYEPPRPIMNRHDSPRPIMNRNDLRHISFSIVDTEYVCLLYTSDAADE